LAKKHLTNLAGSYRRPDHGGLMHTVHSFEVSRSGFEQSVARGDATLGVAHLQR
jgi:hypothetical protein